MSSKHSVLKDSQGIALLMVMSAIAILTYLLADLTFETKINKIQTYNAQDRFQAKLSAQAGLNFGIARLRLYQEAKNALEKNKTAKSAVGAEKLNIIYSFPFAYPLPIPGDADLIQKNALKEFQDKTNLDGQFTLEISLVKGFLNPNNLRAPSDKSQDQEDNFGSSREDNEDQKTKSPQEYIEERLVDTLKNIFETKRENDDEFDRLYGNLEPEMLVKELKFFVNPPNTLNDPDIPDIQSLYRDAGITPKHAPMSSLDELYLLAGWPEAIIDLMKDKLTVHEVSVISLNDLTEEQLRVIFPKIDPISIEEFFRYRDGDPEREEEPNPFKSEKDFKSLIVNRLQVVDENSYEKRAKEFEAAGLKFDVSGKLFKLVSTGNSNRAQYKITAFIDLPIKPVKEENKNQNQDQNRDQNNPNNPNNPTAQNNQNQNNNNKKDEQKEKPVELMAPRVVEIITD